METCPKCGYSELSTPKQMTNVIQTYTDAKGVYYAIASIAPSLTFENGTIVVPLNSPAGQKIVNDIARKAAEPITVAAPAPTVTPTIPTITK